MTGPTVMASSDNQPQLRSALSPDGDEALLIIPEGFPPDQLIPFRCRAALQDNNIEITAQVLSALEELAKSPPPNDQTHRIVVSRCIQPKHGEDGRVEWLIGEASTEDGEQVNEGAGESGKLSFYDCSAYAMVKSGQTIGRIVEPAPGEDGRDLTGRTLPARPGHPAKLNLNDSIMVDAAGNLIVQLDGVFRRKGDSATVTAVLEILGYVDFSTGNVDFAGDVLVHKGVRDCFTVKATGNIDVLGLVEGATVECAGNLIVRGGMGAKERASVQVGNLQGRYLVNVRGNVNQTLGIEKEVLNCELNVGASIKMPHAAIIGGTIAVTGSVEIGELGSSAGVATHIICGSAPLLESHLRRLDDLITRLQQRVDKISKEHKLLEDSSRFHSATQKERIMEVMFELREVNAPLSRALCIRELLFRKLGEQRTVDFTVHRRLYPGVRLTLRDKCYRIDKEVTGPLQIGLDREQPVLKRGDSITPLNRIATLISGARDSAA